jgi:phage-related holin
MQTTGLLFIKYFTVAIFGFFAPIHYAFIFTIILVAVDTITGIMKAGKEDISKISSKKAFPLVPKLIFYFSLVIVAHCCNSWIDKDIPFVKLALIGIGWIEVKSIDENFKTLFGFSFINKCLEGVKAVNQIKRHKEETE